MQDVLKRLSQQSKETQQLSSEPSEHSALIQKLKSKIKQLEEQIQQLPAKVNRKSKIKIWTQLSKMIAALDFVSKNTKFELKKVFVHLNFCPNAWPSH